MKLLKNKKVLILAGVVLTLLLIFGLSNIFGAKKAGDANPSDQSTQQVDGDRVYSLETLNKREPISIDGKAVLTNDNSYFYEAEKGKIEAINVTDGQYVKKGDVLFSYHQDTLQARYDVEDAQREQNSLYEQRQELIKQLRELTGEEYNYQGDKITSYWVDGGKQGYYIQEEIGKDHSSTPQETTSKSGVTNAQLLEQAQSGGTMSDMDNSMMTGMSGMEDPVEGIKDQIRKLNRQIEDAELKLIRLQEQQNGKILSKRNGYVILNEEGQDSSDIPLVRVVSEDISVEGTVGEFEYYLLKENLPVNLYVNAEDRQVKGELVSYDKVPQTTVTPLPSQMGQQTPQTQEAMSGSSDQTKFGFVVEPEEAIQAGYSVKVELNVDGLVIPTAAIVEEGNKNFVFVYHDGKVKKTEVQLERQGTSKIAKKGVKEKDQLVLNPVNLKDGQEIEIAEEPIDAPEEAQ